MKKTASSVPLVESGILSVKTTQSKGGDIWKTIENIGLI